MPVVAIHQPQYLPYLGFFQKIYQADIFVALDNVQFQKRGLQNRNRIKTSGGWQWLTVPVLQRSGQLINEVQINCEVPWVRKHLLSLSSNYGRARFFLEYSQELETILNQEFEELSPLNMALIGWVLARLDIHRPVYYASQLAIEEAEPTDRLVRICQEVGGDAYLTGPGGRNYMNLETFTTAGIELIWQEFESPIYDQLFPQVGFQSNLSIVDALFNCGPMTTQFLE